MPGNSTEVKRRSQITKRKVQWMPLEVLNEKCMARNAQSFPGEPNNVSRLQVMHK
jgi:hypothetical protein